MSKTKGELISQYVTNEIDKVTDEFNNSYPKDKGPNQDFTDSYKSKYLGAIAKGIDDYIKDNFSYDVKTNGAVVIATTPPGSFPIVSYGVDGIFETNGSESLKNYFIATLNKLETNAINNMKKILETILDWLPSKSLQIAVTGSITDSSVNPIVYLSTVSGPMNALVPIEWPQFIPISLATDCVNETSALEFVDKNGKINKNYKDVWDIIGKYIYKGLENNIVNFTPVTGTADTSKIPNGTSYTATLTSGTIKFG